MLFREAVLELRTLDAVFTTYDRRLILLQSGSRRAIWLCGRGVVYWLTSLVWQHQGHEGRPYTPHRLKRRVARSHPIMCFEDAYVKHCRCNIKCSTNIRAHKTTNGCVVHWTLDCKCIGFTKEDQSCCLQKLMAIETRMLRESRGFGLRIYGACQKDLSGYAQGSGFRALS